MRFGQVLHLREGMLEKYREYHRQVWPAVLEQIKASHISNYTIFHRDGMLFAYFEYNGDDFQKDMEKMAADPETRRWWEVMQPMQQPLATCGEGEWWADMEEVFHLE